MTQTYEGGWAVIDAQERIVARAQRGREPEPSAPAGGRVLPIVYALPEASEGWLLGGADTATETVERNSGGSITAITLTFGLVADPWAWPEDLLVDGAPGAGPFHYALVADDAVTRVLRRSRPWRRSQVPPGEDWRTLIEVRPPLADGEQYGDSSDAIRFDRVIRSWAVEPAPPLPVPAEVTPRQIRLALNRLGLRSQVEAAIAQADQDTRDAWEYSIGVERAHPMVNAMAQALARTEQEIDDLFRHAATL